MNASSIGSSPTNSRKYAGADRVSSTSRGADVRGQVAALDRVGDDRSTHLEPVVPEPAAGGVHLGVGRELRGQAGDMEPGDREGDPAPTHGQ